MRRNKVVTNTIYLDNFINLDLLSNLLSDKVGIINAILERRDFFRYSLYMYQSLSAQARVIFDLDREVSSGGLGIDYSRDTAIWACIGESLERYCMSYVKKSDVFYSYWKDLPKKYRIDNFYLYTEDQYKKNKNFFNPMTRKIYWTKCKELIGSSYVYWPASLVFLPFKYGRNVAETSSTGVAAGINLKDAIVNGILELLERDAIMINFLQKLEPPELDINSIKGTNKVLIREIKKAYRLKIYKLYSDIEIPIFLTLIWRKNKKGAHYGIGASAELDSDKAIYKSLKESLFTYFYSKNLMDLRIKNKKRIKALYEHFLFYQDENFYKLVFNSKVKNYKRETYTQQHLIRDIYRNNLRIFYKILTTDDVRMVSNIEVVKVIIPSLIDLNKSYSLRREAAVRFWKVPRKLGLSANSCLSRLPHPFP